MRKKRYLPARIYRQALEHLSDEQMAVLWRQIAGIEPARYSGILSALYGRDGYSIATFREVAEIYGVTTERIRQIESRALCRLRHPRRYREMLDAALTTPPPE